MYIRVVVSVCNCTFLHALAHSLFGMYVHGMWTSIDRCFQLFLDSQDYREAALNC